MKIIKIVLISFFLVGCGSTSIPLTKISSLVPDNPSLDASFGNSGASLTVFRGNRDNIFTDALIEPNGNIIVLGLTSTQPGCLIFCGFGLRIEAHTLVARYSNTGQLDNTFGNRGYRLIPQEQLQNIGLFRRPEGYMVISFYNEYPSELGVKGIVQFTALTPNGKLDMSFGEMGIVRKVVREYLYNGVNGYLFDRAFQLSDGSYYISARKGILDDGPNGREELIVTKFSASGEFDTSFGEQGILTITPNGGIRDYEVDDSNRFIVLIEEADLIGEAKMKRYLPKGQLDITFANDGVLSLGTGLGGLKFTLQNGNDMIVTETRCPQNCIIDTKRIKQSGIIDSTFGNRGKIATSYTRSNNFPEPIENSFILENELILKDNDLYYNYGLNGTDRKLIGKDGSLVTNFNSEDENFRVSTNRFFKQSEDKVIMIGGTSEGALIARYNF